MLRVVLVLGMLASPAAAEERIPRPTTITVGAGAVLPMFLLYEFPGPWVGGAAAWRLNRHVDVVASADTGMVVAPGATRVMLSVGAGVRVVPWRLPLWVQLGFGATSFAERIGVALPERTMHATDRGVALTGDLSVGLHCRGWELAIAYDHQLVSSEPGSMAPQIRDLPEALPYVGTAMIAVGREL